MNWQHIQQARLPALADRIDDADRMESLVERLRSSVERGGLSFSEVDAALAELAQAAAPLDALIALVQLLESESGRDAVGEPGALGTFVTLAAQGDYPARLMTRRPDFIPYLNEARQQNLSRGFASLRAELAARIGEAVDAGEERESAVLRELRRLKRRESLRIYLREVENLSSVRQTTAEIAELAEACLDVCAEQGAALQGDPSLVDHFCVLGMGKLGGRELNFSSDVDLIYFCSERVAGDAEMARKIDALAKWITRAMGSVTGEGYVFRVDLRLRPEGSRGPLVPTLGAMVDYYLNWGRTWERSAMVKARPVAGSRQLGERLLEELEPFIYRRYLDFDVLDELRAMKEQIDQNAQVSAIVGLEEADEEPREQPDRTSKPTSSLQARLRRKMSRAGAGSPRAGKVSLSKSRDSQPEDEQAEVGDETSDSRVEQTGSPLGWDVKIGVGGIREIEFFVQALQLVHCGSRPALRVRRTLDALDRLLYTGLISHDDHAVLADAYDLFRRVEHRVQMEHDRQSHRLPAESAGFERLARRMLFSPDVLRERLTSHRREVARIFERLFTESAQSAEQPTVREQRPSELQTVLGAPAEQLFDPAVLDALSELGFQKPRQVAGQLQVLRDKTYGPFGRHAGTEQSQLSRYILEACSTAPEPDQAFSYWTRLATVVGDRAGFYDMLFENPHATRLLLHVFGSSDFLASIVMREPNVIDYLLGSGTVAIVRSRDEMTHELDRRLRGIDDPSHRLGRVRRFHQEEVLRIALHEVAGACDIEQTLGQLSMLAEVVTQAVLAEVYANLAGRLDAPEGQTPSSSELPFSVVAAGKMGGREMTFGSDLDIIFVYEPREEIGLDHAFFAKLAQRLVRNLTSVSAHGKLYDVDTRLRPSGSQGTLVVSFEAFGQYHREHAEVWERQALIRTRPVTGPDELRERVLQVRDSLAFGEPPEELATEVRQMRAKMREHLDDTRGGFDIKQSPGGMVDVEFLTQYLQLACGGEFGAPPSDPHEQAGGEVIDGVRSQNTLAALDHFADIDELPTGEPTLDCRQLAADYRELRRIEARLRMSDRRASNTLPDNRDALRTLARRLGFQGANAPAQLRSELDALAARVSRAFDAVLGG